VPIGGADHRRPAGQPSSILIYDDDDNDARRGHRKDEEAIELESLSSHRTGGQALADRARTLHTTPCVCRLARKSEGRRKASYCSSSSSRSISPFMRAFSLFLSLSSKKGAWRLQPGIDLEREIELRCRQVRRSDRDRSGSGSGSDQQICEKSGEKLKPEHPCTWMEMKSDAFHSE
jgi:hypothetical protein